MRVLLAAPLLLLATACSAPGNSAQGQIAALRAELAELKAAQPAAVEPPELGAQMLELQIRHARLWQAGQARNWMLAQFQLAEMREAFAGVVESNGDHASLQPGRLAEVLPEKIDPAMKQLQAAVDAGDGTRFDAAYDALSEGCNSCHVTAAHGFLVIQRPRTPVLDNLRAEPSPAQ